MSCCGKPHRMRGLMNKSLLLGLAFFITQAYAGESTPGKNDPISQTRKVSVLLVADEYFVERYENWQEKLKIWMASVSKTFQDEFQIAFEIRDIGIFEIWGDYRKSTFPRGIFEEITYLRKEKVDLIVGVSLFQPDCSQLSDINNFMLLGETFWLNRFALVRALDLPSNCPVQNYSQVKTKLWAQLNPQRVLLHEMAHVFGALDNLVPDSIMSYNSSSLKFDAENHRIISAFREYPFQENLSESTSWDLDRCVEQLIEADGLSLATLEKLFTTFKAAVELQNEFDFYH